MIFKFSYIKHNKFGRKGTIIKGSDTGIIYAINNNSLYKRKYKTDTDKMTASDYTHLFGYLNPYYRTAYSIPKRKR